MNERWEYTPEFAATNSVQVQELAKRLYNECPTVKPSWEQLGDVTRGVWCERAYKLLSRT